MTNYNILPALAGLLALALSVLLYLASRKRAPELYSPGSLRESVGTPFSSLLILLAALGLGLSFWFSPWTVATFLLGAGIATAAGVAARRCLDLAVSQTEGAAGTEKPDAVFLIGLWHGGSVGLAVAGLGLIGVSFLQLLFLRGRIEVNEIVGFALGASLIALLTQLRILPEGESGNRWSGEVGLLQSMLENFVLAVIAAVAIAATGTSTVVNITAGNRLAYMSFPIFVISLGVFSSIVGLLLVRLLLRQGPGTAIRLGTYLAVMLLLAMGYLAVNAMELEIGIFPALLLGVISAIVIALVAEWYVCGVPAAKIAAASRKGPAANVASGLAEAFQFSAFPVLTVCGAVLIAHNYAGLYGIGICAAGMVAMLGMTASFTALTPNFPDSRPAIETGPGSSVSLTQRAIGESMGNGAALMVTLALFAAYSRASGLDGLDLMEPTVIVGLLAGGILPFCAVSLAFKGTGSRRSLLVRALQLTLPLGMPVFVGLILGRGALGGMLVGSIAAGTLLALTLSSAGQLWQQVHRQADVDPGSVGLGNALGLLFQSDGAPAATAAVKCSAVVALIIAPLLG
jgi:K(+)-stimulated pyrophosphate-energized sodium pump